MRPVWLITGASRGIGAAIAVQAAEEGAALVLVARSPSLRDIGRRLTAMGAPTLIVRADITEPGAAESLVSRAIERFGQLDVVVNNAAVHRGGRIADLTDDVVDSVLACGLTAPLRIVRAAAPHLRRGGSIINIGSPVGLRGSEGDAAYGSAKAGLVGLTRVLATELASRPGSP